MRLHLQKIAKILFLIFVRQFYFLGRNLYHLASQPYLTLKRVIDTRDKTQLFLLFLTSLSPSLLYFFGRLLFDYFKYRTIMHSFGSVFLTTLAIQFFIFTYLAYWLYRVLKK